MEKTYLFQRINFDPENPTVYQSVAANLKKRPDIPVHSVTVWEEPEIMGDTFNGRALPVLVSCVTIFFFIFLFFAV